MVQAYYCWESLQGAEECPKKNEKKNEKKEQAKNTGAIYGGNSSSTLLFYYRMLGVNQEVPMQISMMQQSPIASSQKARWWCMD